MKKRIEINHMLDRQALIEKLQAALPEYKISKIPLESGLQIRPNGFTTRAVMVKPKKDNAFELSSSYNLVVLYSLFCLPMGLYMYINRKKHRAFFDKVSSDIEPYLVQ